jgi:DNA-binding SARP family transcriptional activator/tetratricopeptide (TPR) repeat protein
MGEAVNPGLAYVQRRSLLARLARISPQLVALIAPAGFGKSTFARQYVAEGSPFAVCDCARVESDLEFARRLVPALADEMPQRRGALSTRELMLGDGTAGSGERVGLAVAAWREASPASTFVFENAEFLLASSGSRDLFTRLLADRPEGRRIVICSRESLRVHLSRFALPHQIVTLRASDLAFMRDELDEIFAPLALSAQTVERIMSISQGWPIAVLLFARFALEGRLEALLERIDDVAFEDLHDYLADQVIGVLHSALRDALMLAVCIPGATLEDITVTTGSREAAALLAEFAKSSPFVTRTAEGTFAVHPLVSAMLLEREGHLRDELLAAAADAYERREDYLRAAELHLARADQERAARALECVPVAEDLAPRMRYSCVLSAIDRRLVRRHPRLCHDSVVSQAFCTSSTQLLAEMTELSLHPPSGTPPTTTALINAMRVMFLTYLGRFEEAFAFVETMLPDDLASSAPETLGHAYGLFLRGFMLARLGRLDDAERDLQAAWPLIERRDVVASAVLMVRSVDIALVRGEYAKADALLDRSIERLRGSQLPNYTAYRLAEATFSAWFSGDRERFERFACELEEVVERDGIRAFASFSNVVRGRKAEEPSALDLPRWIACGELVAGARAADGVEALTRARSALGAARSSSSPFLCTLAALAVAEFAAGPERAAAMEEAVRASRAVESPALQAEVQAMAAGRDDLVMLRPYVEGRLRQKRGSVPARLHVSIVGGTVCSHGADVALSDRELSLLFALAVRPREVSRERLVEMLWPELGGAAGRNALNVALHRLRLRLGDDEAVVRTVSGYRLCTDASVDLWEVERAAASLLKHDRLTEGQAAELRAVYERVRAPVCPRVALWEWFDPIGRRVAEVRCELAQRLARHMLDRGVPGEALGIAEDMIEHDPCDESAREIAIGALLMAGDRAGALRQFRQYRETLRAELQCEPSTSLAELVGADALLAQR